MGAFFFGIETGFGKAEFVGGERSWIGKKSDDDMYVRMYAYWE